MRFLCILFCVFVIHHYLLFLLHVYYIGTFALCVCFCFLVFLCLGIIPLCFVSCCVLFVLFRVVLCCVLILLHYFVNCCILLFVYYLFAFGGSLLLIPFVLFCFVLLLCVCVCIFVWSCFSLFSIFCMCFRIMFPSGCVLVKCVCFSFLLGKTLRGLVVDVFLCVLLFTYICLHACFGVLFAFVCYLFVLCSLLLYVVLWMSYVY